MAWLCAPFPPAAAYGLLSRASLNDNIYRGLRLGGMVAPMVLDGPINGGWFEAYVEQVLVPTLSVGDVVIMDNRSSHKRAAGRTLIENAGAQLVFLPPYSPDFNPIEKVFAKLKTLLRKAAERTVDGLWIAIGSLIGHITPTMQKLLQ